MITKDSTTPICVGLYRSGQGFHSAEDQISAIEKAAALNNVHLLKVRDLSIGDYANLDDVVSDLTKMKVDCLMVWRLDCLAPLIPDFESVVRFISQLSSCHISFISIQDKVDSDESAARVLPNLHHSWIELKRNRKIENARKSSLKAKANGSKTGPIKRRDDQKILKLHKEGLSIRKIAAETNLSSALIHQVLKKITQKTTKTSNAVTDVSPENV